MVGYNAAHNIVTMPVFYSQNNHCIPVTATSIQLKKAVLKQHESQ